jgi:membrane fusion protein, multidrug efflux system
MLNNDTETTTTTKEPFSGSQLISDKQGGMGKRVLFIVILIAVLIGIPFLLKDFLQKPEAKTKKDAAVPITVSTAKQQVVPIEIRSIGNVLPYSVINVVPQVGGQLRDVHFTQGQYVKKNDLLFQIDPSQYKAALQQAMGNVDKDKAQIEMAQANMSKDQANVGQLRANLSKDQAQLKYAKTEMGRYVTLQQEGAVSSEQRDQIDTNASTAMATIEADQKAIENAQSVVKADKAAIDTARGTLAADQAQADNTRIQLSWCQIRSPIDGRTGSLNVYQGNVVMANATQPLVTIDQVKPIYVTFTVPEQYLDEVRSSMGNQSLMVQVQVEGVKKNAPQGAVSFLENTVNTQTGTVVMRASFPNTELRLFPGQFVDVIVTMPPVGNTVVVPVTALQTTQQGTAVYVVKPDNTVTFCPVEVERTAHDLAAIGKGIQAGDVVVTDGQLQLTPGAKVKIVTDAAKTGGDAMPINDGTTDGTSASQTNANDNQGGASTPAAGAQAGATPGAGAQAGATPGASSGGATASHGGAESSTQPGATTSASPVSDSSSTPDTTAPKMRHSHERLEVGPPSYQIRGNARSSSDNTKAAGQGQ